MKTKKRKATTQAATAAQKPKTKKGKAAGKPPAASRSSTATWKKMKARAWQQNFSVFPGQCANNGSSFAAVHWWHMTFVVLPGRPAHPGIVRGDVADVRKSSGRLQPSCRRTTGKIVGSQSGLLRAASWQQGNLRDGAKYGPTAVCRTGIYTFWAKYGCVIITSVSRGCLRPIGLMGAFAEAGRHCLPTARAHRSNWPPPNFFCALPFGRPFYHTLVGHCKDFRGHRSCGLLTRRCGVMRTGMPKLGIPANGK